MEGCLMITSSTSCIDWHEETLEAKKPPPTVEIFSSHEDFFCFHRFTSGRHFETVVGTQVDAQINPKRPAKTIPTETRWSKIEHYCNPMESLKPPHGRETFLRMWWLRETSNMLSGLWKYLWNNQNHFIHWGLTMYLFMFYFSKVEKWAI